MTTQKKSSKTKPTLAPPHMSKEAGKVFIATVRHMQDLGIYHPADDLLVEQFAVLIAQSRGLQRAIDTGQSEDLGKDLNLLNSLAGQISRISNRLGIAQDSRPESRAKGRPTKQSGLSVTDDDAEVWSNVLSIGGEE